jgi:hypothetical protein
VLHLRHRLLNVSEPRVRHFVLTAGDKSRPPQRSWAEIPLASIRIDII